MNHKPQAMTEERMRQELQYVKEEYAREHDELVTHREKANGNYWCWQGDGEDHPESLTCPVLISADKMRAQLAELTQLRTERDQCKQYAQELVKILALRPDPATEQSAEISRLRKALELLRDHQNGCPLPSYEKGWNEAMKLANEALAAASGTGKEQP